VTLVERVGQTTHFLGHAHTVAQKLQTPFLSVLAAEQGQPIIESMQYLSVGLRQLFGLVDAILEVGKTPVHVLRHLHGGMSCGHVNHQLNSGRRHFSVTDDREREFQVGPSRKESV
jgi:hypothetical protein